MDTLIKIASLIAFSGVKFFLAVPAVVLAGYSYWESILITSIGGILGFFIFFYLGEIAWIRYYFGLLIGKILSLFGIDLESKKKKKFSKKNRFIIKVKGSYGIIGLALLTPCFFSIPLGSLIAARYFDNDKGTIPIMLSSIILWSFILTSFYKFF